jgi:Tfp pilus assembly protein PilE
MKKTSFPTMHQSSRRGIAGITLMEILVGVAIVMVLLAIAYPIYMKMRERAGKAMALEKMKILGSAIATYAGQNNGLLPKEDTGKNDDWSAIASPKAKDAWYNAYPVAVGKKGAGEYPPNTFYTDDNVLYLSGANYPDKKKFNTPMFAIAFNTKLERRDPEGKKERVKLDQITDKSRTVILLEQGLTNESRTLEIQTKTDYDGSPKGSAKSFVGRYDKQGHLCFADGSVRLVKVADQLTETGDFPFPPGDVVWTVNPAENPNKDPIEASASKKKKEKKEK